MVSEHTFFLYPERLSLFNGDMAMGHNPAKIPGSRTADTHAVPVSFDDLLVAVGKTRNRDAFVRLFEYYAPRVKSFLIKGGLTPEQADEVAQETMLTVWQKAPVFDPQKSGAGTWIFTIARNRRIDIQRKGWRDVPLPESMDMPTAVQDAPDSITDAAQSARTLATAIESLPPEQAALIRKVYFEDKTQNDIAAETGIPLGTVKSRIRLALGRLRSTMKEVAA